MDAKFLVELGGKSYPLYAGVLGEAHERGLQAIETALIQIPCAENEYTAIVKAIVRMKDGSVFEEWGDASPRNTSPAIAKAVIRMAATRAKGRALRDACNIGQTLLEELDDMTTVDSAYRPERPAASRAPGANPPPRHAPREAGHKGGQAPAAQQEKRFTMPDDRELTLTQILAGWERAERDALAAGIEPPDLDLLVCEPEDIYRAAMDLARRVSEARKAAAAA